MTGPPTPEGWDDVPAEVIEAGKAMRQVYIGLVAAGFSMIEAATIIGAMLATGNSINPTPPNT